jgi:hypothetical protein
LVDQGLQPFQIRWKFAPGQGPERGHGDPEGVAARQADAPSPNVEGQH